MSIRSGRLDYFPEIYQDETVFSFASRFGRNVFIKDYTNLNRMLFNMNKNARSNQIPRGLAHLSSVMPEASALSAEDLLHKHTVFRYYSAFSNGLRREKLKNAILRNYNMGKSYFEEIDISRLKERMTFCPECQTQMLKDHGEYYWRRADQLPLNFFCQIHSSPLHSSRVPSDSEMSASVVPSERNCDIRCRPIIYKFDDYTHRRLVALGEKSISLLNGCNVVDSATLTYQIRDKLFERGFYPTSKRLERRLLIDRFAEYLNLFKSDGVNIFNAAAFSNDFIFRIVGSNTDKVDTSRYILFNDFIDIQPIIATAIRRSSKEKILAKDKIKKLNLPCLHPVKSDNILHITHVDHAKYQGMKIISRIRCECGYVYSISLCDDGSLGTPRIFEFGSTMIDILSKFANEKLSLKDASELLKLKPASVRFQASLFGGDQLIETLTSNGKKQRLAKRRRVRS